jgi:hypothetical protein
MPCGNLRSLVPEPQMTQTSDNKLVLIVDDTPTNLRVISGVPNGSCRTKVMTQSPGAGAYFVSGFCMSAIGTSRTSHLPGGALSWSSASREG